MMGHEHGGSEEEAHLYASPEEMENLILDDDHSPYSHLPLSNGSHLTTSISTVATRPPSLHPLSSPPEIAASSDGPFSSKASDFILPASSPSFTSSPIHNPNFGSSTATPSSINAFLDPPSYADAMFRSFDGATSEIDHFNGVVGGGSDTYIHITVSDPQRISETSSNSIVPGSNSYYTYLITTRTNYPEFDGTEFNVRRRFSDVVTLSDRLAESYRGFFIPIRPDKNVVESQVMQKNEFVEQRKQAIERYLRKLAIHPVIGKSDEFRVFLQVQGKLPLPKSTDVAFRMVDGAGNLPKQLAGEVAVASHEVVQPAKGGRDIWRLFKELKQSVTNDWSASKPPVVEEDKWFLEKKEKLQDLEQLLSNVSQQAETFVKAQQDIGETVGELGLAFVKLTKFEIEEAVFDSRRVRAGDSRSVATAAVKASRLYRELNAQTVKHLDKLHDYLEVMLAVDNAFADRSSALLTVQTLLSDLSSLQSRIEKLEIASSKIFGGDQSRLSRIEELKETLRATETAKCVATREYERIKENNKTELDRLDKERHDDFFTMLKGFAVNQAGYAEKIASVWEKVAEETRSYATARDVSC